MKRAFAVLVVFVAGCGGSDSSQAPPTVSAAASLKHAFERYDVKARYSFAGSDELAAQIRQGGKPDVFAAANTKLPDALYKEGKVGKPTVFAGNRLVLAVPKDSSFQSLTDAEAPGKKLVIGSPTVPIGTYTRTVLDRLGPKGSKKILANVKSEEPDVGGIVGKLLQGAADAGFVYVTDVQATDGKLRAIELPQQVQPSVAYGAAVVKGAPHPKEAKQFIDGLLGGKGLAVMHTAGFDPPPG